MVMHEDQTQPKFDKSKKNKAKKIPQRGLGVEKLEKLRIEEQQKKNMSSSSSSSAASLQTINFCKPEAIYSLGRGLSMGNAEEIKHLSPIWLVNEAKSIAIEPPSNQNYSFGKHNMHFSSQIDDERTVDTNLRWPFHNVESMKFEYKDTGFSKECNSSSNAYRVDWRNSEVHMNKRLRGNNAFLERESLITLGLQYQGGVNNDVKQSENSSEKTFYTFLPIGETVSEEEAHEQRDEALNDVDTRLKL